MKITKSLALIASLCLAGCASSGDYRAASATAVNLTGNNYRIIQSNVSGESSGFKLLGLIPFVSPKYAVAKANIYKAVHEPLTGRSVALANQTEDRSTIYVILFSLPKLTLTADVIEFTTNAPAK